ncbi:hypothetical protein Acr_17g0003500 [Actinidia rufa]|uniref:Protein LONGIFOLIA 1 n=1 Tax=Actinidia rufa TaxID=165716 RepID=A0A7J0G1Y1_9ERIC|nr:hypothetical protein Acr_17g0003500 [Actinidia rufa]
MTTGIIHDQNLEKHIEKHMGCMAGFFQIFDRNQIMFGKRLYATKRLPPAARVETTAVSRELEKPQQTRAISTPSPDRGNASPATELQSPARTLPLPIFECKEGPRSSWKFCKEAPRLSLDSRATVDAKGSLYPREIRANPVIVSANRCEDSGDREMDGDGKRRSPSVIARLMGLEQLPNSSPAPVKNAELRRSASESRVSRDFLNHRFVQSYNSVGCNKSSNVARDNAGMESTTTSLDVTQVDPMVYCAKNVKSESPKPLYRGVCASPWKLPQQRKSFFDSQDIFPEPKPTVLIHGEIEKRLKMRGIDEPSKDLETLKQILEALQLKGLLHSKKVSEQISHRNFVYERSFSSDESPIVIMKPSKSPIHGSFANDSPPPSFRNRAGVRRNLGNSGESLPSMSPRRERSEIDRSVRNQARPRNSISPSRHETSTKNTSSPVRKRVPLSVETQSKADKSPEPRRASPVPSPRLSPKRTGSDQAIPTRSPRNRKPTAVIEPKVEDESSSVSENSFSTSSQTDTERSKMEEYKGGRTLLERCDKLLHSILEMTATESQPSPVSVLDSSFYESSSPSPVMKRSIDFTDPPEDLEEEIWSPAISPIQSKRNDEPDDSDFVYISDILRATRYLPEDSDVFLLLEKQQHLQGKDTSKSSRLQRKLIFDTVTEILHRNRQLPPWKAISWSNTRPSLRQIWSEFQKIRERDTAEKDLFDVICSVLRKDLAGDAIHGWGDCPVEISDAVFHIERLVFKDLIGETIQDLAALAGNCIVPAPRRKLVF